MAAIRGRSPNHGPGTVKAAVRCERMAAAGSTGAHRLPGGAPYGQPAKERTRGADGAGAAVAGAPDARPEGSIPTFRPKK
jgi:hypothetical protein